MSRLTLFGLFAVTAMLVMLRLRESQPLVHPGVQRGLRAGLDLRLPAGRLAVWNCGGYLVAGGAAALVAGGARPERSTTNHVGADALICPAERSSANFVIARTSASFADNEPRASSTGQIRTSSPTSVRGRSQAQVCPHEVCGRCLISRWDVVSFSNSILKSSTEVSSNHDRRPAHAGHKHHFDRYESGWRSRVFIICRTPHMPWANQPPKGEKLWSGRGDLNPRPPAPKAGALPGCATPRLSTT